MNIPAPSNPTITAVTAAAKVVYEAVPIGKMINLADIVFPDGEHPYEAGQVLEFWLRPERDLVNLCEGCDQYYGVDLNASQVDLLIAFLQRLRSQMVES